MGIPDTTDSNASRISWVSDSDEAGVAPHRKEAADGTGLGPNDQSAPEGLEETIRARDEFISSISHELRTPLSLIVGLAETLRSGRHSESELAEFHALIADQAQEMALIVEDLLVAGRIDADTLTIREATIDLAEEIDAVVRPWEQTGDFALSVILRPGARQAFVDPLRFRQILRNLLANALRYGEPPVEIKGVRARDQVILSVSDNGQGVGEDVLERMFEPYAWFAGVGGQPSAVGLGLHVARRLAILMGGDLVYKDNAANTTFVLTLPAEPPDGTSHTSDPTRFLNF